MKTDIRMEMLKPGEIIPLNYNFMFTQIFNKKENIAITEYFLADMADIPLHLVRGNVEILSRNLDLENKKVRSNEVDLLLDINGVKINFEISRNMSAGILNRNIVYGCNIHKSQLKYGDNRYKDIKATIQIQLNNFDCNDGKLRKTYFLRDETGEILSQNFQIDVIDMAFGSRLWYTSRDDRKARWCRILRVRTEKDLKEVLGEDFMDKECTQRLIDETKKYSHDKENYAMYMKLSRAELEHNTIMAELEEEKENLKEEKENLKEEKENLREEKKRMVQKLKLTGMNLEQIIEITELSKEEIENL